MWTSIFTTAPLSICFVHPDLGLGGAEMLVVETAAALSRRGHHVEVFTSYHDPKRAFSETIDGTLDVHVHDSIVPRSIFGRFINPLACIRFFWTSAKVMMRHKNLAGGYDLIFVDQISLTIPLLKYSGVPVVYYCHYPDMLLTERTSLIKKVYRAPIDFLEEITTDQADEILVNSKFTAGVFQRTFKSIKRDPTVIYPTVHTDRITAGKPSSKASSAQSSQNQSPTASTSTSASSSPANPSSPETQAADKEKHSSPSSLSEPSRSGSLSLSKGTVIIPESLVELAGKRFFLSLNRYERKKNHGLAIEAMALLLKNVDDANRAKLRLVIAGGWDERVAENVQHFKELQLHAKKLGVDSYVLFYRKVSDLERNWLLWSCRVVLYTPENEHFGIVPLEAGVALRPVIACDSGGPRESVVNELTGYHCAPDPSLWAEKMLHLLQHPDVAKHMGENAVKRVVNHFSPNVIIPKLEDIMYSVTIRS
jgi:alpha-1,3/alpha-1,6-mannosyltransferase